MMKILMIFSYFTDGFAYAGEALTGRYIGAKDKSMVRQTVRWTFVWSMSIALIFMGIYHFGGVSLVRLMTEDAIVVEQSKAYIPWLLLMPVVGCAAFTWDGIYIGATASKAIRNSMIWAVAAFGMVWAAGLALLNLIDAGAGSERYDILAMHALMAAYFAHLLARTVYLSIRYRISVLETPFCARP
jgi:MATE family multidrug resistance protein